MEPRPTAYLESLASELIAQADRVRDLIGDAHWFHDGRHKENLLSATIRRHLPRAASADTGFVVSPTQGTCSREQDVLVADWTAEAPPFHQGGLTIAFPKTVLAVVSVKSSFTRATFRDAVSGLLSARRVAVTSGVDPLSIWCGAYFFGELVCRDKTLPLKWYREILESKDCETLRDGIPTRLIPADVVASAGTYAFIADDERIDTESRTRLRAFKCDRNLATAVLLAHLIDHVSVRLQGMRAQIADYADVDDIKLYCTQLVTSAPIG